MAKPNLDDLQGPLAPPRKNGELVFEAPWESRAFGLAIALSEQGVFGWDEFRSRLAEEIAAAGDEPAQGYYRYWLAALESVTVAKGVVSADNLEVKTAEIAARRPEDDHEHDGHDHDHHH